jgi:hypothetical protein
MHQDILLTPVIRRRSARAWRRKLGQNPRLRLGVTRREHDGQIELYRIVERGEGSQLRLGTAAELPKLAVADTTGDMSERKSENESEGGECRPVRSNQTVWPTMYFGPSSRPRVILVLYNCN